MNIGGGTLSTAERQLFIDTLFEYEGSRYFLIEKKMPGQYRFIYDVQPLPIGDLVVSHNTILQHSHSRKLDDKWRGPYRIREVSDNLTFYYLDDQLDGTHLAATLTGNRLKKFFSRDAQRAEQHETIRVRDLDDVERCGGDSRWIRRENMEMGENGDD